MASLVPTHNVCLIAIDGWGIGPGDAGDAIHQAHTPVMDSFRANASLYAELEAHQFAVGLPEGVMGNSEVGHLTIGAGQVQFQDLARINLSIKDGSFFQNAVILQALSRAKSGNGTHSPVFHFNVISCIDFISDIRSSAFSGSGL
jgi:2,3-bisphosphoglycerate-independent phosphoglycerate mutase